MQLRWDPGRQFPVPILGRLPSDAGFEGLDPELRNLEENGTVMAGSYSITYPFAGDTLTMEPEWRFVAEEVQEPGVGAIDSPLVATLDSYGGPIGGAYASKE